MCKCSDFFELWNSITHKTTTSNQPLSSVLNEKISFLTFFNINVNEIMNCLLIYINN